MDAMLCVWTRRCVPHVLRLSLDGLTKLATESCGQRIKVTSGFHTSVVCPAFKSDLTIKWIRPEPIPAHDLRKSGDLEKMPKLDMTQVHELLRDSKVFQEASADVKKMFTFEYTSFRVAARQYKRDVMKKSRSHVWDTGSFEATIGALTGHIRTMQHHMEQLKKDKVCKVRLLESIGRRTRLLKHLRRMDYKRFEWVLDQLNIIYKPHPTFQHWVTRRSSLRRLTDKHCDRIMSERLEAYKTKLESQQEEFLQEKIQTFEWILKEREELGQTDDLDQKDAIETEKRELDEARVKLGKIKSGEARREKVAASE